MDEIIEIRKKNAVILSFVYLILSWTAYYVNVV